MLSVPVRSFRCVASVDAKQSGDPRRPDVSREGREAARTQGRKRGNVLHRFSPPLLPLLVSLPHPSRHRQTMSNLSNSQIRVSPVSLFCSRTPLTHSPSRPESTKR